MCILLSVTVCLQNWYCDYIAIILCVCSVTQLCSTLCNRMDCRPPGSSVHGILQARIPEWVAVFLSRGSFWLKDQIRFFCFSCLSRQSLYHRCHLGSRYPAHTDRIKFKRKIIQRVFFSSYNECCDACFLNLDLVETYSETKSCMKEFYWEERICSGEK